MQFYSLYSYCEYFESQVIKSTIMIPCVFMFKKVSNFLRIWDWRTGFCWIALWFQCRSKMVELLSIVHLGHYIYNGNSSILGATKGGSGGSKHCYCFQEILLA